MARKVFRYGPLEIAEGPQQLHLPVNAKIIHVGNKTNGFIDIWALVDEDAAEHTAPRTFQVFGTGHPIPEDAQYCGTTIHGVSITVQNGSLVWHIFERLID